MSTPLDDAIAAMDAVRQARERLKALEEDRDKTRQRLDDLQAQIAAQKDSMQGLQRTAKVAVAAAL